MIPENKSKFNFFSNMHNCYKRILLDKIKFGINKLGRHQLYS